MTNIIFLCSTVLLLEVTIQVQLQKIVLPVKYVNTILTSMLSQYPDYDVIIHFDNTTSQETYTFLDNRQDTLQKLLLLNYDLKNLYDRPDGGRFVHVVFLTNPFDFTQFCEIPFNLEFNDIIFILSNDNIDNKTQHFWQQAGLERAGSVFVLNLQNNDLYHECFYCGNMSGVLQNISDKQITTIPNYTNCFSNFYGQHFKVGYMQYLPFFRYEESSEVKSLGGPEGKLLEILSTTLNFQYSLENFESRAEEQWKAMIDAIHYRKLDWAVGGISASTERAELVDMTKNIHTEMYRVLFRCCSSRNSWHQLWPKVLSPFHYSLWLCIGIMLVAMPLLLKLINDYLANNSSISILKDFEITMRGLIEQPLKQIPTKYVTGRLLLISWWYFAIIITTSYRSKLASSLIRPYYNQLNSIQELLRDGYTFQVNNEDWSVLKEYFERSADPMYAEVLKRSNNELNICSSIQQAVENKVAIIDEETSLQYEVITNCGALLSSEDFSDLRVVAQDVFLSEHVWPLQLAAPYKRAFSMVVGDLFSSGILSRWYKLAIKTTIPSSNRYNENKSLASPLPMSTMLGPLLILFIGLLLATIIFMCEMAYFSLNYLILFHKQHNIVLQI